MLTEQLTNDAAALHQAVLRHGGEVSPFFCGKELGWAHRRIARAMEELVDGGILEPSAAVLPKPLKQRKTYTLPEIQALLAAFPAFARAIHAVEHAAGRRLPTADLSALTELFDFHGLSPEALELLTAQCYDEAILRGEERPTARRIEKLGLEWARLGVRSRADAVAAVRRMARREQTVTEVRRRLRLDPDARIPSDDAYIAAWLDWGFPPALIELAFDRTVLNCGRLNWKYCHGILESWRKNGLFTVSDVLEKDAPPQKPESAPEPDDPWRYIP